MAAPEDVTFFSSVDRTSEPGFFLRFLDEANNGGPIYVRRTKRECSFTALRR